MRKKFIEILKKKINTNKKLFLIVGDLGFNVIEPISKNFPKNFLNVGVAEQNMAGIAAGIASEGYHVFIYSIANFPTFRCAEQIRNDIDYHNLNVTIVSVGAGLGYGHQGYSHHAIQDYSLMRSFPNMEILSPGDNFELDLCMNYCFNKSGPKYLRLDKDEIKDNKPTKKINVFKGSFRKIVSKNKRKIILSTGSCIDLAIKLNKKKQFNDFSIYSMPIWSMKNKLKIKKMIKTFSDILVVENHLEDGGFSSWLRELNGSNKFTKIRSFSLSSKVVGKVGDKNYLEKKYFTLK